MKVQLLTNEYPPNVYGGAGIHVEYLSRELAKLMEVDVRAFGRQKISKGKLKVKGFPSSLPKSTAPKTVSRALDAIQRCVDFNALRIDANICHAHTWYTHFAGILAKFCYDIPLVVTVHSLEPLRPWKREQLEGGYDLSCWVERQALENADAIIAVSSETKRDILKYFDVSAKRIHVIHNGIDTQEYRPVHRPQLLKPYGLNNAGPYVLFLGRVTRQKGIHHFLRACRYVNDAFPIVLCASSPDTEQIRAEVDRELARLAKTGKTVIVIPSMVDTPTKIALYSHAGVFCCPSIYEPFGIINLEAMACETAVVANAVGGIPEVIQHGKTGLLIPFKAQSKNSNEPAHPDQLARKMGASINRLMKDPSLRKRMGKAGRKRAVEKFSWKKIAKDTVSLYRSLI